MSSGPKKWAEEEEERLWAAAIDRWKAHTAEMQLARAMKAEQALRRLLDNEHLRLTRREFNELAAAHTCIEEMLS